MCQKPGTFIDFDKAIEVESAIQKNRPPDCNPITHLCGEDANEVYELNAEIFLNMTGLINNVDASIWDKNSYIIHLRTEFFFRKGGGQVTGY